MNTPTHIACGACLAYVLVRATPSMRESRKRIALTALCCVLGGMFSHLALDLLPHYAWIVYLDGFDQVPYHWLIREALAGIVIAVPATLLAGKLWPYAMLGMFGGIYPDIEKVFSVDFHLPDLFILFHRHSTSLSNRTGGLPLPLLIAMECAMIAMVLFIMWRLSREKQRNS